MSAELPRYPLRADSGELGANGYLKLAGCHELLCRVIELDQEHHGSSINDTLAHGYAWAVISLSMEVMQPVRSCGLLFGQTWLSEAAHPYYRREIELTDEAGGAVLHASLFMVPLNASTHRIEPSDSLIDSGFSIGGRHTVEWAQPRTKKPSAALFTPVDTQLVRPSDIDALGHLNNCRYGAYTYDAAVLRGHDIFGKSFGYSIYFLRQCMPGERLAIGCCTDENGRFTVSGTGDSDGRIRFLSSVWSI